MRTHLVSLVIGTLSAALISACATAGDEPPPQNSPDSGNPPPVSDAGPLCGNGAIDPGETCEPGNLGGATCESEGYEGGVLGCGADCQFDTRNCYACGDGKRNGDEQCDGVELGGATCLSQGYLGGVLLCDAVTCTYDTSTCDGDQVLSNHNGTCDYQVGCTNNPAADGSNPGGTSGNPQSLVECFNSADLSPPFQLTEVTYTIGASVPAPTSLNLEVYSWTGAGIPGSKIANVALNASQRSTGTHTITLASPVDITSQDFCLGLGAVDPNDGFRVAYSRTSTVTGASWVDYSTCGTNGFTATADRSTIGPGNFCFSATITK